RLAQPSVERLCINGCNRTDHGGGEDDQQPAHQAERLGGPGTGVHGFRRAPSTRPVCERAIRPRRDERSCRGSPANLAVAARMREEKVPPSRKSTATLNIRGMSMSIRAPGHSFVRSNSVTTTAGY